MSCWPALGGSSLRSRWRECRRWPWATWGRARQHCARRRCTAWVRDGGVQALALGGWGNVDILLSAVLQPIPLSPPPPFPSRCVSAPAGPPAGRGRGSAAGPAVRPQGAAARRRGAHLRAGGGASEVGGRKGRYPAHKERLSSSCIISATLLTSPPPVSPLPPLQPCRGLPLWPLPRLYSPTGCGPLRTSRGGRRGAERALPAGVVDQ